jgi:hypothetical protein
MIELGPETLSRPAFATTTDTYGKTTAPAMAIHRKGPCKKTAATKQKVRIIIEMKYRCWRTRWSLVSDSCALVIDKAGATLCTFDRPK